jgi:hypothetical protein
VKAEMADKPVLPVPVGKVAPLVPVDKPARAEWAEWAVPVEWAAPAVVNPTAASDDARRAV